MDRLQPRNPKTRVFLSYAFDWIFCAILLALFFLLDRVEPFHREFSVEDRAIMFPYEPKETIAVWAVVLITGVFPLVVILVVGLGIRRSPYDFHNGILGLLLSILMTTMFTQAMKVTVGKHRPDFLARCNPMLMGLPVVKDIPLRLWTVRVCSQPDHHILKDGMRSFPSGHASTSFAGLTYISLWMAGKMRVFDRRGYSLKVVLLIVPILAALLVSISRIQDYRHAGVDVTWGGIIGIIFAIFAYLQYYPSPTSPYPDVPNPPRHLPWMPRNNEGQGAGSSRLENATGIQHNHDLVDESRHVQNNSVYEGQAYNDDGARVGTTVQRDRAV